VDKETEQLLESQAQEMVDMVMPLIERVLWKQWKSALIAFRYEILMQGKGYTTISRQDLKTTD